MAAVSPVNAFIPADEVRDPERFAGRIDQLQALSRALEADGVQIVIYGNRGVGKSSLAHQLANLATGQSAVLERLRSPPSRKLDFVPVYFRCDDSVSSIPKLLLRMLTDESALAPWVPFRVMERQGAEEIGGRLSVKVLEISGKKGATVTEEAAELENDVVSVFVNAATRVASSNVAKDGLLLIIDEIDRIGDRRGLASLLKVLGPQKVTFALVGVATTVQDLILEHESVARQLTDGTVLVPPMTSPEMQEIFNRAEALLDHKFTFQLDARSWVIEVARGHPFYVHLIGKHALLRTIDEHGTVVTKETAEAALRSIALKGSAPIQETLYKTAIGHSFIRERLLKAFASVEADEIHTTELYARLARDLSVDPSVISVYVGQLGSEKYGAVLEKTRERYYRFRDSLFKAYAAARPPQLIPGDQEDG